jgi:hypothetical protein
MVDRKGIEPFLLECKTNVLPLSLTARVSPLSWINGALKPYMVEQTGFEPAWRNAGRVTASCPTVGTSTP